ncbi:MAG: efflux RND transporter periplasmic adaptor subunit [Deltaproteobacteria bacterium]|nr:efflux RND transporter periplasmic adaptor subunit [Deltaproteobacteria bacterium]
MSAFRIALVCAALAWACGGDAPAAEPGAPAAPSGPPPALVAVGTARGGGLGDHVRFLGQVEATWRADLAAGTDGRIVSIAGREGDRVERGEPVVTLDEALIRAEDEAARAEKARVRAQLTQARRQNERVKKLSYPVVSEPEQERYALDVATLSSELAVLTARSEQIAVRRERHQVKAPFSGVITRRMVDPGAWIVAGQPLLSLVSVDDVEILVDVAAELRSQLEVGGPARAMTEPPVPLRIAGVVPALDPSTRTLRVRLVPAGASAAAAGEEADGDAPAEADGAETIGAAAATAAAPLLPGLAVEIEFPRQLGTDGVVVSRDALVAGPIDTRVMKLVDGKAVPVPVRVLGTSGADALVAGEGLAEGDTVVTRGNERLRPGQPVTVTE